MDLDSDLEMAVPSPGRPRSGSPAPPEAVIALGWWYDRGFDGALPHDSQAASTAELVAYWWGELDAVRGFERRNIS